jgi:ankyrin repeat protein
MWAVANQQAEAARVLIAHGAALTARTATVRQLRGTGKESTTSPVGSTEFDAGGFTPLLFAARNGDLASVSSCWMPERT